MSAAEQKQVAERQQNNVVPMSSTDQFIQQAIQSNAPVETLERLFDLKQRHEATEARKAFYEAMQTFQRLKPVLPKTRDVSFGNGKAAYKFCPLDVMEEKLREPLDQCNLSYRFQNLQDGDRSGIRCIVSHVQGHSEHTDMYAPADNSGNKNQIQGLGSTSTYLQRYTLVAALGLTTADEDNDGATTGDMPYTMLVLHNKTVRENFQAIAGIKEALAEDDYLQCAMIFDHMSDEVKRSLWIAPSKGGVFTTEERTKLKSDEFGKASRAYAAEKQQNNS